MELLAPEDKKKICFVVASPMTVKAFLVEPIRKLSTHYDIYIVSDVKDMRELECVKDMATLISIPIQRKVSFFADVAALLALISTVRQYSFDAIHSITPKAGLLGMLAAFICRVPLRIHTFTGQVWATKDGMKRFALKAFDWLIAKVASHVLVDSHSQRQFLLDEKIISAGKAEVLAHGSISGVNLARFRPDPQRRESVRKDYSLDSEDVLILYLGRLTSDKGIRDLIKAFALLKHENAHVLLVGPDEDGMRVSLLSEAKGSAERVHFVEFTEEPEKYMAAADIFCLPSYREGFGSVIIEAAAAGIPSVGSRIYGLTDAIEGNVSGLLFEAGNVTDLENKLSKLVQDSKLRMLFGAQALRRAQEKFSSELVSTAWADYYKQVL